MEIKAFVKGLEVVASGVIHFSANSPIDIFINGMHMQVRFTEDFSNPMSRYESKVEGNTWVLYLANFSHMTGEGLYGPIPVTYVDGKQLSLCFSVGTVNRLAGMRTFSYTFLHG